jgi:tetratricopeptide (TPR) repeat protein
LAHAQQWERAERVARSLENSQIRARALSALAEALTNAQQWKRAIALWEEAEAIARTISYDSDRFQALAELARSLAQAQQWERAERVARLIEKSWWYSAETLCWLGSELARASHWEQAKIILDEAERTASSLEYGPTRAVQLGKLAKVLTQVQQQERSDYLWTQAAAAAANSINKTDVDERYDGYYALEELVEMLVQVQQWEQARVMARSIWDNSIRGRVLCGLGKALAYAQHQELAEAVWKEVLPTDFFLDN